ncbi:MAG: hypothetical protein ACREI7_05655, partial [Myxococcota bacterium]
MPAHFFATAWSTAVLFSLLSNSDWFLELRVSPGSPKALFETALAISALVVLWRPGSRAALLGMAALQLADVAWMLPFAFNHRLVLAAVNAALLVCAARAAWRSPGSRPPPHPIECSAPAARATVVLVYAFAFLAKLNTDFLDPASSCAVAFSRHISPLVDQVPGAAHAAAYGTMLVEAVLPLLLIVRRTRAYGAILGLGFHLVLSFDLVRHFVDFSAVMSALLLLFVRLDMGEDANRRWSRRLAIAFGILIAAGFGVHTLGDSDRGTRLILVMVVQLLWVVYAAGLIVLAVRFRGAAPVGARETFGMRPALVPIVALVALNGLAPYLGLKTHTAWNMYSNLDVQPDRSNHLLVPRSLDVLGLQGEVATLIAVQPGAEELHSLLRDRIPGYFEHAHLREHVRLLEPDARWTRLELERLWAILPELSVAQRRALARSALDAQERARAALQSALHPHHVSRHSR